MQTADAERVNCCLHHCLPMRCAIRDGNTMICHSIDRLWRNLGDLKKQVLIRTGAA